MTRGRHERGRFERAAAMLLHARRTGERLAALPDPLRPMSANEGYRVQSFLVSLAGEGAAGWKVGGTSEQAQQMLGIDEPFTGVILGRNVRSHGADLVATGVTQAFAEAEYIFRLSAVGLDELSVPGRILDAVQSIHLGIELCDTAFASIVEPGIASLIADNGVAGWTIIGDRIQPSSREELRSRSVELRVNGVRKGLGYGSKVLGNPFNALEWLATHLAAAGQDIPSGSLVLSGSCTGMTKVGGGDRIDATFDGFGAVSVHL